MHLRIGRILGVEVRIHATFWLIIGLVVFNLASRGASVAGVLLETVFVLVVFGCVVLHELGHALAARRYGIATREITLYPIGGVAVLERMPDNPRQELVVALAGPAVNLALVALLAPVTLLGVGTEPGHLGANLSRLALVNLFLAAFNLLPAFPMDGGRVLRAVLAMRMRQTKASRIAASTGQGMALLFAVAGFLWNPLLLAIAVFVWIGAAGEGARARIKDSLSNVPVSQGLLSDFLCVQPHDRLNRAVEMTLDGSQKDFPVVTERTIVGLLTQDKLIEAIAERGTSTLVSDVMRPDLPEVDSRTSLDRALALMDEHQVPCLAVLEADKPVGLVTRDNIFELMLLREACGGRNPIRWADHSSVSEVTSAAPAFQN